VSLSGLRLYGYEHGGYNILVSAPLTRWHSMTGHRTLSTRTWVAACRGNAFSIIASIQLSGSHGSNIFMGALPLLALPWG